MDQSCRKWGGEESTHAPTRSRQAVCMCVPMNRPGQARHDRYERAEPPWPCILMLEALWGGAGMQMTACLADLGVTQMAAALARVRLHLSIRYRRCQVCHGACLLDALGDLPKLHAYTHLRCGAGSVCNMRPAPIPSQHGEWNVILAAVKPMHACMRHSHELIHPGMQYHA